MRQPSPIRVLDAPSRTPAEGTFSLRLARELKGEPGPDYRGRALDEVEVDGYPGGIFA